MPPCRLARPGSLTRGCRSAGPTRSRTLVPTQKPSLGATCCTRTLAPARSCRRTGKAEVSRSTAGSPDPLMSACDRGWGGHDLVDRDGVQAGSIVDLYIDEQTEQPIWALVRTGLLGSRQTLVPLEQATVPLTAMISGAGSVQVPFENATILDAPTVAVGEEISDAAAVALRRYYGLGDPAAPAEGDDGQPGTEPLDAGAAVPAAAATKEMTTASTEPSGTMVRSEEELTVRMRRRARRVRIKRYVVTDYVTQTIPVRREELRLEAAE